MRIAICPGSFDPVTYGHLDIFKRASTLFDKVIVVVTTNPDKRPFFTPEERMEMIREVTVDVPNIEVDCHCGLLMDYVREKGACAVVKGLRAVSDFEYEFQMALINKKICPEAETVFLTTDVNNMYLSSSIVRQLALFGGDLSGLIPHCLHERVYERLKKKQGG
ncbi:MAG: pantetheine-phosphate adenylyltransferase [Oscillospiraceae bacterium]|nr:pantetheine-phosphate adenylyltransferase [Oscillospiraceae bacterium]MBP1557644.1 pantetheine-phosphate adenylyltransferase [Oscillospiraceae bacterium]